MQRYRDCKIRVCDKVLINWFRPFYILFFLKLLTIALTLNLQGMTVESVNKLVKTMILYFKNVKDYISLVTRLYFSIFCVEK